MTRTNHECIKIQNTFKIIKLSILVSFIISHSLILDNAYF